MIAASLAGWTAPAAAGLPPLPPPPITLPSLTIPTVTVPPVTTPSVTTPSVPQPRQAPPAPTVPGVTLPSVHPPPGVGGGGSSVSGAGSGASSSAGSRGGSAQSSGGAVQSPQLAGVSSTRMYRLRLARDWISTSGPKRQRRTRLVFVLRKPTLVEFVVVQVAPNCRRIGRFRVRGQRGVNRVDLRGRIGRHSLASGTYRIVARTLPGGQTISDTRLVVVQRASREQIRKARSADSCPRGAESGSGSSSGPVDPGVGGRSGAAESDKAAQPARPRGVLGAKFAKRAISAANGVPLWLFLLFTLAIVLLSAGAFLPKAAPAGLAASLVFGMTGALVLFLVTIAYARL